jgi:hypothetical protein
VGEVLAVDVSCIVALTTTVNVQIKYNGPMRRAVFGVSFCYPSFYFLFPFFLFFSFCLFILILAPYVYMWLLLMMKIQLVLGDFNDKVDQALQ